MFPYRDENETVRTPVVTWRSSRSTRRCGSGAGRGLACALASRLQLGLIPGELTLAARSGTPFPMGEGLACVVDPGPRAQHIFTSMFLHGGWMHMLGNMWFLWLFGNNVEDSMGRGRFMVFYLLCGIGGRAAQVIADPPRSCRWSARRARSAA